MNWKICKHESSDLSFALSCLFNEAITLQEFRQWVELVISSANISNLPSFVFDLLEFNDDIFKIYDTIGFVPDKEVTLEEENAIIGLAFIRNKSLYDSPITEKTAINALKNQPLIKSRFENTFPFIDTQLIR